MDVQDAALKGDSNLTIGVTYRDAKVAQANRLTYEEFLEYPHDERVTMIALWEIDWRTETLVRAEQERARERKRRKPKRGK